MEVVPGTDLVVMCRVGAEGVGAHLARELMAFSTTRVQRRQPRDSFTEWILLALIALTVALSVYVVIIR